jgi:hypothetical protein
MKTSLILLSLVVSVLTLAVTGSRADGVLTSPGLATGWNGVPARGGAVRYVALPGRRETIVAAVRVPGGRVQHWGVLPGGFGLPLVAYDGTTGGLSADGRTLVLGSFDMRRFAVVGTRALALRRMIRLRGVWSFDAVSPDASTLFLVQYAGPGPNVAYRVRAYDVAESRLVPGAIVDRSEEEAVMRGQPVTRVQSADGRWAYTLYARQEHEPFVHALDTVRREAHCVDLPLELGWAKQMALRLKFRRDGALEIRRGRSTLAVVDTGTFEASRG